MKSGRHPLPAEDAESVPGSAYREMLTEIDSICSRDKPQNRVELRNRIDSYFDNCKKSGLRPGVETLALSLAVCRQTIWRWSRGIGCDEEWSEEIQYALQRIAATLEQAHLQGKINPVSAIFLSKCWLGYRENDVVKDAPGLPDTAHLSPEQVQEQLLDIPLDEQ